MGRKEEGRDCTQEVSFAIDDYSFFKRSHGQEFPTLVGSVDFEDLRKSGEVVTAHLQKPSLMPLFKCLCVWQISGYHAKLQNSVHFEI